MSHEEVLCCRNFWYTRALTSCKYQEPGDGETSRQWKLPQILVASEQVWNYVPLKESLDSQRKPTHPQGLGLSKGHIKNLSAFPQ